MILKIIFGLGLLIISLYSSAQSKLEESSRCIHLNEAMEKEYGFCAAVQSDQHLYISGTVGSGEMKKAMSEAYDSLSKILSARGLDFTDVIRETVFTTNLDAFSDHRAIRKSYYKGTYPAASWVQVNKLYGGKYSVEIEVTAKLRL